MESCVAKISNTSYIICDTKGYITSAVELRKVDDGTTEVTNCASELAIYRPASHNSQKLYHKSYFGVLN